MKIQGMFVDDINRKINGVVKVDQSENEILLQELNEYVITEELKKHFRAFFTAYDAAFRVPTADIGVWISGFFGSGKSHFLKMLSYLLENKEIQGKRIVDRFRPKFADAPDIADLIVDATRGNTHTILFNIDVEGSIIKDKTAVLRVFAKMFYNFLGFYGEDLKVAKLEQFIDNQGKTEEFRRVFAENNGASWVDTRSSYVFFEDDIVKTLQQVLGMSQNAAENWFNSSEQVEMSIAQLVSEMKAYVSRQSDDFRLLYMIDEVGQYVGADTDLLLNLQSLVEEIGAKCGGKIWVVCTGQDALDQVIKTRQDEFSRIQARFKTRLTLSSSSADEVIQKRILRKTPEAEIRLTQVYEENASILRNLFTFTEAVMDIKGYSDAGDFSRNFPFVPYQFILLQKVFTEIRNHGNSGKHLSGGERSMLSGFQEAAQKIQDRDEYTLAPFYLFYDTVHTFLDSGIRMVIERCERAARNGDGIEYQDVDVLKLLYLIRYLKDIKGTLDNIVILMADSLTIDKIVAREKVSASLDRLLRQNYIGKSDNVYQFLTNEEQDIQKEISNVPVDTANIVEKMGDILFDDLYTDAKVTVEKSVFPFSRYMDDTCHGSPNEEITLQFLSVATDETEKNELQLLTRSSGKVLVVLGDESYYEPLQAAEKIRKYVKQNNVTQLPESIQSIIRSYNDKASKYEKVARTNLEKAATVGQFYVDGDRFFPSSGSLKQKVSQALDKLVHSVYTHLEEMEQHVESDSDVAGILTGKIKWTQGMEPNQEASAQILDYLEMQERNHLPTSMADIQAKYQKKPYGWREIDIAAVTAQLIQGQKIIIKRGGMPQRADYPRLVDMLRKKSEIGSTSVYKRQMLSKQKIRQIKDLLQDYFDSMNIPDDEDGLATVIINKFSELQEHYKELLNKYVGHSYPDKDLVEKSRDLVKEILDRQKDNIALFNGLLAQEDTLFNLKERIQAVEDFFGRQQKLFDQAKTMLEDLRPDQPDYISHDREASEAWNRMGSILLVSPGSRFNYSRIPELNGLMKTVRDCHQIMLQKRKQELLDELAYDQQAVHQAAESNPQAEAMAQKLDKSFGDKKIQIEKCNLLGLLDGIKIRMDSFYQQSIAEVEIVRQKLLSSTTQEIREDGGDIGQSQFNVYPRDVKIVQKDLVFPANTLQTEQDIDNYIELARAKMKKLLKGHEGIRLS